MTTQISAETISLTVHQNTPVVTTELLAQLYGTEINNIKVNFTRNANRFICGKHYFKVAGDELKNLRVTLSNSQNPISAKTRSLILWTERGAARHAKMLETDQAWEVFEKLEDSYFSQKKSLPAEPIYPPFSADHANRTELIYYHDFKPIFCRVLRPDEMVTTPESLKEWMEMRGLIFFTREELKNLTLGEIDLLLSSC